MVLSFHGPSVGLLLTTGLPVSRLTVLRRMFSVRDGGDPVRVAAGPDFTVRNEAELV